jgi:dipeptidyl aminopeptidase/acylaminoacyl peptidase
MEGILIKPVGYRAGLRYPLIVDGYPGTVDGFQAGPLGGNQAWAAKGYAVFFPNPRAPHAWVNPFKNVAFDHAGIGPKGWEVTLDDVLSGVDTLIHQGFVDPDRMGLYGFSNGGGTVNYLVTQTNRFKCAVSVAGTLGDWVRPMLLHTDNRTLKAWANDVDPWANLQEYVQLSAVFRTEKIRTPMLLADGDEDGDFLLDTIEMYNGLRWFGKDVMLLRYPGQGHGFTGPALKDFWMRENDFFDKYLKPQEPSH